MRTITGNVKCLYAKASRLSSNHRFRNREVAPPAGPQPASYCPRTRELPTQYTLDDRLTTGVIVSGADLLTVPSLAKSFKVVGTWRVAPPAVTEKAALVWPAGIVSAAGVESTAVLVLKNEIATPAAGAGAGIETVPCTTAPGATFPEASEIEASAVGEPWPGAKTTAMASGGISTPCT